MKRVSAVLKGGFHLGTAYLNDTVGVLAKCNLDLLESMACTLDGLTGPFVVGGDWNCSPEELKASGWLKRVKGVIVAPAAPTCNDNTFDYFVVHRSIAHLVHSVHKVADAGLSPHSPARLILKGRSRQVMVRQIKAPFACPANLPHGPLPENCYTHTNDPLHDWNMGIDQDYTDLTAVTVNILKHLSGANTDDGSKTPDWGKGPQYVWRNLSPSKTSELPRTNPVSRAWR